MLNILELLIHTRKEICTYIRITNVGIIMNSNE